MVDISNPLIPANDAARLQDLASYQLLDARSEKVLDDVVAATARLFGVSNAMLSIVEKDTVLVKAPYNLPVPIERVPREQSICSSTILQDDTAVFEDLARATIPGVDTSLLLQLGLSFYAGHNLRTPEGYNLGSLCVYDGPPRQFSPTERALLATLAGLVMRLLELRRTLGAHADSTAVLWEPVYRAIGGQLTRLTELAKRTTPPGEPPGITEAVVADVKAIAAVVEQFVAATLKRV
ncbi:GAF domain-containing protein [Hymenobacter properus]|uniref:GAF domain-containing protein n=1 Tax=Hymenobacter properus TaxID=2791026 RepID=A0A931BES5_9BACT|nr:GAF domain-containing protein [Hymenobacter properus]MBF9142084.1 GAF domain-containing protein [Hymenobacter properus]MBR7720891.1 GAF domain-containing protein [Microvirga sp. SRT04]